MVLSQLATWILSIGTFPKEILRAYKRKPISYVHFMSYFEYYWTLFEKMCRIFP